MYSEEEITAQYPFIDYEKIESLQDFSDEIRFFAAGLIEEGYSIEFVDQLQKVVWSCESIRVQDMLAARERENRYYGMTPSQMIDSLLDEIGMARQ